MTTTSLPQHTRYFHRKPFRYIVKADNQNWTPLIMTGTMHSSE